MLLLCAMIFICADKATTGRPLGWVLNQNAYFSEMSGRDIRATTEASTVTPASDLSLTPSRNKTDATVILEHCSASLKSQDYPYLLTHSLSHL